MFLMVFHIKNNDELFKRLLNNTIDFCLYYLYIALSLKKYLTCNKIKIWNF